MRLIDADKLKAHYSWWKGGSREMTMDEAKSDFDTIIDLQPTVEVEPIEVRAAYEQKAYNKGYADGIADSAKHGRWEQVEVVHDRKDAKIQDWQQAKCSVCGKWHTTPYMYYLKLDDYCPNCGARMDEVEE